MTTIEVVISLPSMAPTPLLLAHDRRLELGVPAVLLWPVLFTSPQLPVRFAALSPLRPFETTFSRLLSPDAHRRLCYNISGARQSPASLPIFYTDYIPPDCRWQLARPKIPSTTSHLLFPLFVCVAAIKQSPQTFPFTTSPVQDSVLGQAPRLHSGWWSHTCESDPPSALSRGLCELFDATCRP